MNNYERLEFKCYTDLIENYIESLIGKYLGTKFKTNKEYEQSHYYKHSKENHIFGKLVDIEYKPFSTDLIYVIEYTSSHTGRANTKEIYARYLDKDE